MPKTTLENFIRNEIEKRCKIWGVEFETEMPPEFLVTEHAERRLLERMRVSKRKLKETVVKAWHAKRVDSAKLNRKLYNSHLHHGNHKVVGRELMGFVFLFRYGVYRQDFPPQKVLISVM